MLYLFAMMGHDSDQDGDFELTLGAFEHHWEHFGATLAKRPKLKRPVRVGALNSACRSGGVTYPRSLALIFFESDKNTS